MIIMMMFQTQKSGKTPLHFAVESQQLEVARFILSGGGRGSHNGGGDGDTGGKEESSSCERENREAEAMRHLDASQRTKLEVCSDLLWEANIFDSIGNITYLSIISKVITSGMEVGIQQRPTQRERNQAPVCA